MKKLLKFEVRKLFKKTSTYIFLVLFLLVPIINIVATKFLGGGFMFDGGEEYIKLSCADLVVSAFYSQAASYPIYFIILGIFIPIFCCDDHSEKTIKNIYARGFSKDKFYFAKYIVSLVYVLAVTLICILVSFILSFALIGSASGFSSKVILNLFCQILTIIATHALFFAFTTKKWNAGGSIGINILFSIVLIVPFILVDSYVIAMQLNPSFYLSYLSPMALMFRMSDINAANNMYVAAIVSSLIYVVVFFAFGYLFNRKKKVKVG